MNQEQKIKKVSVNDPIEDLQQLASVIIPKMLGDTGHVTVHDQGEVIETEDGTMDDKNDENSVAHAAAIATTDASHAQKKILVAVINKGGEVMMVAYPGDTDKWREYGFPITKQTVMDVGTCAKVEGEKAKQGIFDGTAELEVKPCDKAKEFTHRVTKGDPNDDSSYIDIKIPAMSSTLKTVVQIIESYRNTPLYFKSTGHNADGPGPESEPYGGGVRIK